jgi:hypothetical protein
MRVLLWLFTIITWFFSSRSFHYSSFLSRSPRGVAFFSYGQSLYSSSVRVRASQRASSTEDFMDLIRSNATISLRDMLTRLPIEDLKLTEMKAVMHKLGVPPGSLRKSELKAILKALKNSEEFPTKREMPRRLMSNIKALNVLANGDLTNEDTGIEVLEQHATPLRIKRIKDGERFWRLYSELEDDKLWNNLADDKSSYVWNRSDLVEAFKDEKLYGLEIKGGGDLFFLLPCLCIVKDSLVSSVWTHTRARRKGFATMLIKLLRVRNVLNPTYDSLPFWKACGLYDCEGVQSLLSVQDHQLLG